eukprot:6017746-Amphidinium_carterae.1
MAISWVWLLPWAEELALCCGAVAADNATSTLPLLYGLANFLTGYFLLREVSFGLRGEPPSAKDAAVQPRFGDCLPSNALLGGHFRLSKAGSERCNEHQSQAHVSATGRGVFVPARPRSHMSECATCENDQQCKQLALRPTPQDGLVRELWLGHIASLAARCRLGLT